MQFQTKQFSLKVSLGIYGREGKREIKTDQAISFINITFCIYFFQSSIYKDLQQADFTHMHGNQMNMDRPQQVPRVVTVYWVNNMQIEKDLQAGP